MILCYLATFLQLKKPLLTERQNYLTESIAVWSQILMLLKERIKNTSNALSDITCKLFFFRANYALTVASYWLLV